MWKLSSGSTGADYWSQTSASKLFHRREAAKNGARRNKQAWCIGAVYAELEMTGDAKPYVWEGKPRYLPIWLSTGVAPGRPCLLTAGSENGRHFDWRSSCADICRLVRTHILTDSVNKEEMQPERFAGQWDSRKGREQCVAETAAPRGTSLSNETQCSSNIVTATYLACHRHVGATGRVCCLLASSSRWCCCCCCCDFL